MPQEHTYRHSIYTMRRGGVRREASKVTRDDGAVVRLCDLFPAATAIARARKLFDSKRSYNGTQPEELAARLLKADASNRDVRIAVHDLLGALLEALPEEHELYAAVKAAHGRPTVFRMG